MKKAVIICCLLFVSFGVLFMLFFGKTTVKKNTADLMKVYTYEESPFYKNILKNNHKIIYLNVLSADSPYSFERYQELVKDSTKIVYNVFTDNDSVIIKNAIKKFGIKNDITLENYNYQKVILKNIYYDRSFSFGGFMEVSSYSTPETFVFDKDTLKESF